MLPLIAQHLPRIAELCRRHEVRRLELFGSAARGDFDAERSDIDLLVLFQRNRHMAPDEQYFGLLEELQAILGRKVDLVDVAAHRNPYFMASALEHRTSLYAA